jgi:hypothetical protein
MREGLNYFMRGTCEKNTISGGLCFYSLFIQNIILLTGVGDEEGPGILNITARIKRP